MAPPAATAPPNGAFMPDLRLKKHAATPAPLAMPYAPTVAIVEQDGGLYAWIIEEPHRVVTTLGGRHD